MKLPFSAYELGNMKSAGHVLKLHMYQSHAYDISDVQVLSDLPIINNQLAQWLIKHMNYNTLYNMNHSMDKINDILLPYK